MMKHSLLLSLREDVSLFETSEESLILQTPTARLSLEQLSVGLKAVLQALKSDRLTKDDLSAIAPGSDRAWELPRFYYFLEKFFSLGLICYWQRWCCCRQLINLSLRMSN